MEILGIKEKNLNFHTKSNNVNSMMFQLLFIDSVKAFRADKTGSVVVELNFFFLKTFNL